MYLSNFCSSISSLHCLSRLLPDQAQRAEGEAGMTASGRWSPGKVASIYDTGGDGLLSAKDLDTDSMKLASALLAEKRQRQKEQSLTKPMGLHSHLKLHDLKSVPHSISAKDLLRPKAREKANKDP